MLIVRWVVGSIPQGGPIELVLVTSTAPWQVIWYTVFGMWHIKAFSCWSERVAHVAAAGFLSCYLSGPLPYNRKYFVLSVSLNKIFPSFTECLGFVFCLQTVSGSPTRSQTEGITRSHGQKITNNICRQSDGFEGLDWCFLNIQLHLITTIFVLWSLLCYIVFAIIVI